MRDATSMQNQIVRDRKSVHVLNEMNAAQQEVTMKPTVNPSLLKLPLKKQKIVVYNEDHTKIAYKLDVGISPNRIKTSSADVVVQGLNTIGPFKELTISKIPSETVSNQSLLLRSNPLGPPPLIPLQFQTYARKNTQSLEIKSGQKLFVRKSIQTATNTNISLLMATPSATNSLTVNNSHANRSLVYRKPVTTKDTAPSNNCNEAIHCIDLTETDPITNDKPNHCLANCVDDGKSETIVQSTDSLVAAHFGTVVKNEPVHVTNFEISTTHKQYLQNQYINRTTSIGNSQFPHIKDAVDNIVEWAKISKQKRPIEISSTMNDTLAKCQAKKRSRAKSAYVSHLDDIEMPAKISEKMSDSSEVINLDELPDAKEKTEPRVHRVATHDVLYNMIKSDATKALEQRLIKKKPDISGIACNSKTIQISNGQLSDVRGPIGLLDKSTKSIANTGVMHIARIQSQNAAIASLPIKDKARKLKESIETKEYVLNCLENGDEKPVIAPFNNLDGVRRTYSRSKSVSAKSQMHFKIGNLAKTQKFKKISRRPIDINHDQDWQAFTNIMLTNVAHSDSSGKNTPSDNANSSRATSPTDIEQVLTWNTSKTYAQLPSSQVIFQKNEFNMLEMDGLAMTKIRAMTSRKSQHKHFPQFEPAMACGHPDFAGCFDAIVQRLNNGNPNISCKINEKKPHQYFSTEFKEIIGALVQKKNNDCQAIKTVDIIEALRETNMFDRTKNSSHFSWDRFIEYYNKKSAKDAQMQLAPAELFINAIPKTPNTFEIGQKLEAIDPQNSNFFCVCTIVEKSGYRLKLRFDGYPPIYDFWVNADSLNIFPAGWCSRTGRELEVNRRFINHRTMSFDWKEYLKQTKTQAVHHACFTKLNTARTQMNPFKIGMKLEADDIRNSNRLCAATIGDVIDSRILVTLDGLDSSCNFWTDIRSPYIHPINFHLENGYSISAPPTWRSNPFSWDGYLRMNRAEPVPRDAFHMREPRPFRVGMCLEVVDKKNPSLIRPAVITMIQDYYIKVLFIGWPERYAYWVDDDSSNIFPPGYCKKSGHPIECPLDDFIYNSPENTCGTPGCRGIGNAKKTDAYTHTMPEDCPYQKNNWTADENQLRPNRIDRKHKAVNSAFNIGAGLSRKVPANPAFDKVQVSLQPTLNPTELAAMSSKDVEIFRRLQASANFLLENRKALSELRDQWIDRLKPLRPVQIMAAEKNPMNWNRDEVATFVSQLPNCSMLGTTFAEHDIDGLALLSLRQSDMIDIMGLSMGSAIKVFNRIVLLREECNTHYIRYE